MRISPAVTSSRPATMRSSVDFPQPEGPTSTRNSPSRTESVTSWTAWPSRPNDLLTPVSSTPDIGGLGTPPAAAQQVHGDVAREQPERPDHEPRQFRLERMDERVGVGEQPRVAAEHLLAEPRQ